MAAVRSFREKRVAPEGQRVGAKGECDEACRAALEIPLVDVTGLFECLQ
jgi:hypothetical protein